MHNRVHKQKRNLIGRNVCTSGKISAPSQLHFRFRYSGWRQKDSRRCGNHTDVCMIYRCIANNIACILDKNIDITGTLDIVSFTLKTYERSSRKIVLVIISRVYRGFIES